MPATGVQLDTGVWRADDVRAGGGGPVVARVAPEGVQEATGVGPVLTGVQVVATQLLPEPAAAGVHELTAVGPVFTVLQVVVV